MSIFNQFAVTIALIIGWMLQICALTINDLTADAKTTLTWIAMSCFIFAALLLLTEMVRYLAHRGK